MTDHTELAIARRRNTTDGLALWAAAEPDGHGLKEEGMARAREAGDVQCWRAEFRTAAEALARRGVPFTSEDVTAVVGLPRDPQQNRNNAVGAMMNALARRGLIRKTGRRVQSMHLQSHCREILEWVGVEG